MTSTLTFGTCLCREVHHRSQVISSSIDNGGSGSPGKFAQKFSAKFPAEREPHYLYYDESCVSPNHSIFHMRPSITKTNNTFSGISGARTLYYSVKMNIVSIYDLLFKESICSWRSILTPYKKRVKDY